MSTLTKPERIRSRENIQNIREESGMPVSMLILLLENVVVIQQKVNLIIFVLVGLAGMIEGRT